MLDVLDKYDYKTQERIGGCGVLAMYSHFKNRGFGVRPFERTIENGNATFGCDVYIDYIEKTVSAEIKSDLKSGESGNFFLELDILSKDKSKVTNPGYLRNLRSFNHGELLYFVPLMGIVFIINAQKYVDVAFEIIEKEKLKEIYVYNKGRETGSLKEDYQALGYIYSFSNFCKVFKQKHGDTFYDDFKIESVPPEAMRVFTKEILKGNPVVNYENYSFPDVNCIMNKVPLLKKLASSYGSNEWLNQIVRNMPINQFSQGLQLSKLISAK